MLSIQYNTGKGGLFQLTSVNLHLFLRADYGCFGHFQHKNSVVDFREKHSYD